jgi:TrmH family RNA methyltransferase
MISKSELKYYSSLLQKKYRSAERKFIVEGKKSINEAILSKYSPEVVFVSTAFIKESEAYIADLHSKNLIIKEVTEIDFKKLSDTETPQGVSAVFKNKKEFSKSSLKEFLKSDRNLAIYLDSISDPGNLGTIIRNADWFNISDIFMNSNCVELYNPKVIRATMGSLFHLNVFEHVDQSFFFSEMKKEGYKILISTLEGENIYTFNKNGKFILCLHNEAHGASIELKNIADSKISIPKKGKAESLNVASASAILFSEFTK